MINLPLTNYRSNIKIQNYPPKNNFIDAKLSSNNVHFTGKTNNYLNKEIIKQGRVFQNELISLFSSDKSLKQNFELLTKLLFKDFNFELRDIKEVKYADIVKNPPVIFSKLDFESDKPLTKLYLNFNKIEDARQNAVIPILYFNKFASQIANNVLEGNEYNLISNYTDEFRNKLYSLRNIDADSVDREIKEISKRHNLDINCKVKSQRGTNCHVSNYVEKDEIFSTLSFGLNLGNKELIQGLSHEFNHLMSENSIAFNKIYNNNISSNIGNKLENLEQGLATLYKTNTQILNAPTKTRKESYDVLLKNLFVSRKNNIESALPFIEYLTKNEVFAYSKTPGIFEEYKRNPSRIPQGWLYADFYKYLLSIKYDASKLTLINS